LKLEPKKIWNAFTKCFKNLPRSGTSPDEKLQALVRFLGSSEVMPHKLWWALPVEISYKGTSVINGGEYLIGHRRSYSNQVPSMDEYELIQVQYRNVRKVMLACGSLQNSVHVGMNAVRQLPAQSEALRPRSHAKFFIIQAKNFGNSGKTFWEIGKNFAVAPGHTQKFP